MSTHKKTLTALIFCAFVSLVGAQTRDSPIARSADSPVRIVSLVPAVTEMLYAIGAGSRVIAVSSYDGFPPQVKKLPNVGALLDPNVERILSLKPDLVIVYASQGDLKQQLTRRGIGHLHYRHGRACDGT